MADVKTTYLDSYNVTVPDKHEQTYCLNKGYTVINWTSI